MSYINKKVIDILESEELLSDMKDEYGFNLKKDLKNNDLKRDDFFQILQDLFFDINATPIKGYKVTAIHPFSVYKMRYKDENRNIGSSNAYRLLCMVDESNAIPFHFIYITRHPGKSLRLILLTARKRPVEE